MVLYPHYNNCSYCFYYLYVLFLYFVISPVTGSLDLLELNKIQYNNSKLYHVVYTYMHNFSRKNSDFCPTANLFSRSMTILSYANVFSSHHSMYSTIMTNVHILSLHTAIYPEIMQEFC